MSHIGRLPIKIPQGVTVTYKDNLVTVTGPKGTLLQTMKPEIVLVIDNEHVVVGKKTEAGKSNALFGLYRSLINNMVQGVTVGFNKGLELFGLGYRAAVADKKLVLNVGFSHQVFIPIPDDLTITVEENRINVQGTDKQHVGEMAAVIRRVRPPEPYKGKGIHYVGEKIRRKAGKSVKAAGVAGGVK